MKIKVLFIALSMCCTTLLAGCEKNQSDNFDRPSDKVVQSFNEMYPDAQNTTWSREGRYSVAKFTLPQRTGYASDYSCAWYSDSTGDWDRTETDILYNDLPDAVRASFEAGKYADWRIDDIERIEKKDVPANYLIEVERLDMEVELLYSEAGELLGENSDSDIDDDSDYLPGEYPALEDFISQRYPGARIEEIDVEEDHIVVEILHNQIEKDIYFTKENIWIRTEIDIRYKELPEAVKTAFNAGEYSNWRVDDTELWELADETVNFVLEIEKNEIEYTLYYNETGQLIKAEDDCGNEIDDNADHGSYAEIRNFIEENYPGAKIIEIEREDGHIIAEIRHDRKDKEVHFANDFSWIQTETELRAKELPQPVKDMLKAEYPEARIEDAELIEKPDQIYYVVELEINDNDFEVVILPDGTLIK